MSDVYHASVKGYTGGPVYTQSAAEQARDYRPRYPVGYQPRQLDSVRLTVHRDTIRRPSRPGIAELTSAELSKARARGRRSSVSAPQRPPAPGVTRPRRQRIGPRAQRLIAVLASEPRDWTAAELAEHEHIYPSDVGRILRQGWAAQRCLVSQRHNSTGRLIHVYRFRPHLPAPEGTGESGSREPQPQPEAA